MQRPAARRIGHRAAEARRKISHGVTKSRRRIFSVSRWLCGLFSVPRSPWNDFGHGLLGATAPGALAGLLNALTQLLSALLQSSFPVARGAPRSSLAPGPHPGAVAQRVRTSQRLKAARA